MINTEEASKIVKSQNLLKENLNKLLIEGVDYGKFPPSDKNCLMKAGAEKILLMLGLECKYEILSSHEDWDNGIFGYTIKCNLVNEENISKSEGVGSCNTLEKNYVKTSNKINKTDSDKPQSFNFQNIVLKMAKKRAFVDAILTASGLSDLFTQDLDDIDLNTGEVKQKERNTAQKQENKEPQKDNNKEENCFVCSLCGKGVSEKIRNYSLNKYGRSLCYDCQKTQGVSK